MSLLVARARGESLRMTYMSMSMWREDGESNKRSVIIVIYGAGRCYLGRR